MNAPAAPAPDRSYLIDDPAVERTAAYAFVATGTDRWQVAPWPSGLLRHYGGLLVSQALAAAQMTVGDAQPCHALHAFFARPGRIDRPLDVTVSRQTDGRSFAQRLVAIAQDGAPVLTLMASFHADEPASSHQPAMPDVPPPETLPSLAVLVDLQGDRLPQRHWPFWRRRQRVDWRPVEPFAFSGPVEPQPSRHFWLRFDEPVDGPLAHHQRLLAYASDAHLFQTSLIPRGISWTDDRLQTSSLDHAMWFHAPFRVDDWLLYALDSPVSSGSRGLASGQVFTRDGVLVATVIQQGLGRILPHRREGAI